MPELPEVEVTRLGIAPDLIGRRVVSATIRTPALRYPLPQGLDRLLTGQVLNAVERRGKYLLLGFSTGQLLIHLGMSGSLRLVSADTPPMRHDHVDIGFDEIGSNPMAILRLRDPRRFGAVLWIVGDPVAHPLLANLGIEPLSPGFDTDWLVAQFRGLSTPVKPALMDGRRIVGIGNIYASESLFRAGIDPRTPAGRLSRRRLERLGPAIKATLSAAIAAGGSSLRDFVRSDGSSGYFQQNYFVYGRANEACRICERAIRTLRQAQRATFYCPACQR